MTNFKIFAVAALAAGLLGSCCSVSADPSAAGSPAPSAAGDKIETGQSEIQKNSEKFGGGDRMISETAAREKAEAFTASRNWGPATSVAEQGENFVVFFKTTKRESALLSQRAVLVNKTTGAVSDQRRR